MPGLSNSSRRSDDIRSRRSTRTSPAAPVLKKRQPRSTQHTPPPVMVRSSVESASLPEARRNSHASHTANIWRGKNARRRYDVALGVPGAEFRLPSLPQVRMNWRWLSALLVLGLGFALYMVWSSPNFRVEQAKINGLKRLSTKDVNAVLALGNRPIFTLDPKGMEQKLQRSFPELSAVSVTVGLPNSVVITATERIPVLIWRLNGHSDLVDADGMAFPLRSEAQPGSLPVVEASSPPPALDSVAPAAVADAPVTDQATADLLGISPTTPDTRSPAAVQPKTASRRFLTPQMVAAVLTLNAQKPQNTPLVYNAQHGLGWKDGRGWDVYFGDITEIDTKLSLYKEIVKQLQAQEVQPVLVSVEYTHAPYYRAQQ
ncbi:MAG TPA: FtsQ-type POTRA domain-containing protein [Anaerolineales bacterium]